jgi:hypothetical protein
MKISQEPGVSGVTSAKKPITTKTTPMIFLVLGFSDKKFLKRSFIFLSILKTQKN